MTKPEVAQIVAALEKPSGDISKRIATGLSVLVAVGTIYALFFQPQTLAAASEDAKEMVQEHTAEIHDRLDRRLDRMEGKLDRLIERK